MVLEFDDRDENGKPAGGPGAEKVALILLILACFNRPADPVTGLRAGSRLISPRGAWGCKKSLTGPAK